MDSYTHLKISQTEKKIAHENPKTIGLALKGDRNTWTYQGQLEKLQQAWRKPTSLSSKIWQANVRGLLENDQTTRLGGGLLCRNP
jgi:hypothetical protein